MVEFCSYCRVSLPKADVTFREGKTFVSHDYLCPSCGRAANPRQDKHETEKIEFDPEKDMIIRDGKSEAQ